MCIEATYQASSSTKKASKKETETLVPLAVVIFIFSDELKLLKMCEE